jgi:hypothetical protein
VEIFALQQISLTQNRRLNSIAHNGAFLTHLLERNLARLPGGIALA